MKKNDEQFIAQRGKILKMLLTCVTSTSVYSAHVTNRHTTYFFSLALVRAIVMKHRAIDQVTIFKYKELKALSIIYSK